jgi:hypothetical protein
VDKPTGFFSLQTPLDLLDKMERDYERMCMAPLDVDAAFDFFVAAHHLPEWLGQAKCAPGELGDYGRALHAVCAQLANGAKHFATKGRHDAVTDTAVVPPALYGQAIWGVSRWGDPTGSLEVHFAADEAAILGWPVLSTDDLALRVLEYWRDHEAVRRAKALLRPTSG